MKNVTKTIIFVLISTAMGVAETPKQLGAWSVYTADGNLTSNHVVLLQSMSEEQHKDALGNVIQAKLDVICKKGKLSAIALEPNVTIEKRVMDYSAALPTTRVAYTLGAQSEQFENWAVSDNGRALSPYSEVFQGKLMRRWIERISNAKRMAFQLDGKAGQALAQPTFATGDLVQALSSVGCSY